VTECVYGLDLVRLQLLIAGGQPLPFTETPPRRGHAIEVRLYAEDPEHDWRPQSGTLHRFRVPTVDGVRVDSGFEDGNEVGVFYDPMLAKVIAWAPSREEAARQLAAALVRAELHGVLTNRDLLVRVLRDPEFRGGGTDTAFLDRHPEVFAPLLDVEGRRHAALAAALARSAARGSALPSGWRNVASAPQTVVFALAAEDIEIAYRFDRAGALVESTVDGAPHAATAVRVTPAEVLLETDGCRRTYRVHSVGDVSYVDSFEGSVALVERPRFPEPVLVRAAGSLLAPMPGTVGPVAATLGQAVAEGDLLLTLEAMKLEHPVRAPAAGTVTQLNVATGDQVETGAVLVIVTPDNDQRSES